MAYHLDHDAAVLVIRVHCMEQVAGLDFEPANAAGGAVAGHHADPGLIRGSRKHAPKRPIRSMARSVAPNSKAPASDVTSPPSNAATTARLSTTPNSNCSALHSVGIGVLRETEKSRCSTTTFADSSSPDAPNKCEKCGLAYNIRRLVTLDRMATA